LRSHYIAMTNVQLLTLMSLPSKGYTNHDIIVVGNITSPYIAHISIINSAILCDGYTWGMILTSNFTCWL
jgi:hypothetical protein